MGLIDIFRPKAGGIVPTKSADPVEDYYSLVELNALIEKYGYAAVEKNFVDGGSLFNAYENADSFGNFFGTEFDIRATAGRIKSTYTREPWVNTAATLIARRLASIPFDVKNTTDKEINKDHPLNKKLEAQNNLQSNMEIEWCGYLDLVLGGNFFMGFDQNYLEALQLPIELCSLKVREDCRGIDSITLWDNQRSCYANSIDYKQVVHIKYPNPFNPYYGLSMMTAAARPVLLDRYKNEFEMSFYLRGATNAGVIETTEDINKSRMERLMRTFEQAYTGKRNWWRTIFLPKGAKWVKSGLTMSEMQHLEGLRENRLTLLAVLGIPPSQVGIVQDVNRSTAEAQERAMYENCLVPLAKFIASGWNNSYLVKTIYGGKVFVEPNFSEIEALQGSLETKGAQAKSMENYFTIDEIRDKVYKAEPAPDGKGKLFFIELQKQAAAPALTPGVSEPAAPTAEPIAPDQITEGHAEALNYSVLKAQAANSQERIERKLSQAFVAGYDAYLKLFLDFVAEALSRNLEVRKFIKSRYQQLERAYVQGTEKALVSALERGFSYAASQSKSAMLQTKAMQKRIRFSETDQQAIDALREEQADGQKIQLVKRAIERFAGIDATRTDEVMELIGQGMEQGLSLDQIAAEVRTNYTETYKNQAFTIARTEVLTAVSQGIKWNHDVLGQVFSEVQKQWFTVGDAGTNPDARERHVGFEQEGPQPSTYKWGGVLEYPRDPNGGADETINCRCTMVSVIPDDATSNADVILENT